MTTRYLIFFIVLWGASCSGEDKVLEPQPDAEHDQSSSDLGTPDLGKKDDLGVSDFGQSDMQKTLQAEKGKRCDPLNRTGIISMQRREGKLLLQGLVYSTPDPFVGALQSKNAHCAFYKAANCPPSQYGVPCIDGDKACVQGTCEDTPEVVKNISINVSNGSENESFQLDSKWKGTLSGDDLSMDIFWTKYHIVVGSMPLPKPLEDLKMVREGTSNAPRKLEITWTPPDKDTRIFTHIPVNHHEYNDGTFVECEIASSTGALTIGETMLKPLATKTGLEFQSVRHTNFAAVDTPEGCIEIRYLYNEFPKGK